MFSKVFGIGLSGIDAYEVSVEVDVSDGLPAFVMVGVLAAEVKEAQDRVRTALRNGGFTLRPQKVTVNLSPAGVRKSGTAFDLAIAAGVLGAYGVIDCTAFQDVVLLGELGLDGQVRPVRGVLSMVMEAKRCGKKICVVPQDNVREGQIIPGIQMLGIQWVKELPEFTKFAEILEKVLETPEILEDTTFYWEYKKGYDVWIARVKKEQLKIMAANPSVEMVAYELGYMKDNMTLEQLEQVFGQFDVKVQQSKWGKAIRESIELRQRIEPGRLAPEFTLARRDSSLVSLADYRGKVVVLDFWASWCSPCRASFPWVREFYEEYREKGVEIIGVSIDENKASWEKALDEERLPWPQVIDEIEKGRSRVGGLYHVLAVPMFVVVDKEGKIVVRAHMEKKELSAVVEKVLGK